MPTIGHIGRYALKYKSGAGGLGTVYAAHDPLLSRLIAIKTLNLEIAPEEHEAFNALFYAKDEPKKPATATAPAPAKKAEPLDINTASREDLVKLKGIGDARTDAITKGRPYKAKNELVDKKIVPGNVYNDIKEQIVAKQAAAKPADDKKKKKGGC